MIDKLTEIVKPFLDDNNITVSEDTTLIKDLGLDSFTLIEIVSAIEEEFDISIPDKRIKSLISVKDLIVCINELK